MGEPALRVMQPLEDGASYTLLSKAGCVGIHLHDAEGDEAVVFLTRDRLRKLIEDLTVVGGLQQTPPTVERAPALAGAVRRNFELLRELEKINPAAADQIVASIAAHLRSWRPLALLQGDAL